MLIGVSVDFAPGQSLNAVHWWLCYDIGANDAQASDNEFELSLAVMFIIYRGSGLRSPD